MERERIIKDWIKVNSHLDIIDSSRFYTLFHEKRSMQELKTIFSYYPFNDQLLDAILALFHPFLPEKKIFTDYPLIENKIDKNDAYKIIERSCLEKKRFFLNNNNDEFVEIIDRSLCHFEEYDTTSFSDLIINNDLPEIWLNEELGDFFRVNRVSTDANMYILYEALYGLVTNFQLVWFLMSPLFITNYDTSLYFKIWQGGWDYAIGVDKIFVTNKFKSK